MNGYPNEARGVCVLCDEPITDYDAWMPLNSAQLAHHECSLRSVLGGIGHLIAHDYWCQEPRHDPDAGLTYRQSAKLCVALVDVLGIEEATQRSLAS
jgi:hypothetical protein